MAASAQVQPKKAVLIIVDGIPEEMVLSTPTLNLDRITAQGHYLPSYVGGERGGASETPTISSNGYAATVTGTWGNKNNVYDNSLKAVNYNYPSIFRLYQDAYPEGKTAIFSTWLDNRTKLLGAGLEATNRLRFDYHFDGLEHDTVQYPHDKVSNYIKRIDTHVALEAAKCIAKEAPDLTWVYLQYTDDVSHMHGKSEPFRNGIVFTDALVGLIYDAVRQREEAYQEDWLVLVVTDHGRTPFVYTHHGGQSEAERNTWVVINKEVNNYARNFRVANTDVTPTIAEHMGVSIPDEVAREIDGVSLLSEVDAVNLTCRLIDDRHLFLSWDAVDLNTDATARVSVAFTDRYNTGGRDSYQEVGTVRLKEQSAVVTLPQSASGMVKVLLQTPNHYLNNRVKVMP
ncbi:MAG: alkaline phosphatase family protein [Porphyromonas sp.]|nr:alkaline phosphatase family protein [Porphyromonas sp.]